MAAYPSGRFDTNRIHFQLAMLAYKFNCWLVVFNREPEADSTKLKHTILALARLRFLLIAAKLWNHAGRSSPRQWPPTGGHKQTATLPIGALCTRLILQSAVVCFDANARVNTEGRKPLHHAGSRSHRCYIHRYNLQGTRHCGLPPM